LRSGEAAALLSARGVVRRYPERGRRWTTGPAGLAALDGVTLDLHRGEILGLLGRSGAGKSTLGRVLLGLERPDAGSVAFEGQPLTTFTRRAVRGFRRGVQAVFQDPYGALDPRQRIESIVAEPLAIHDLARGGERRERAAALLREVGLPAERSFLRRRPGDLSGGERQRVAIARAIACRPQALVLDEPVSALDASVRGQVLNLLLELHERTGLAMLLIVHDVTLVTRMCTRVAVMAGGRIVEEGPPGSVLAHPSHHATVELLAAARSLPRLSPAAAGREPAGRS
jgi:peptide/nickel transport system ATP-binding protein